MQNTLESSPRTAVDSRLKMNSGVLGVLFSFIRLHLGIFLSFQSFTCTLWFQKSVTLFEATLELSQDTKLRGETDGLQKMLVAESWH